MAATTPRIPDVANEEARQIPEPCAGYREDLVMALSELIRDQVGRTDKQRQDLITKYVDSISARVIKIQGRQAP
jgi:hypothetical protein